MCTSTESVLEYIRGLDHGDKLILFSDIVDALKSEGIGKNSLEIWMMNETHPVLKAEMNKLNENIAQSQSSQHTATLQGIKQGIQNSSRKGGKRKSRKALRRRRTTRRR